jgi:hypothetical protein
MILMNVRLVFDEVMMIVRDKKMYLLNEKEKEGEGR